MHKVYLSLGSNLGETKTNLQTAMALLEEQVHITRQSSYYETEPVGYEDQPWFLNMVLEGETKLSPFELLAFTQSIEGRMKRIKTMINGPRNIDVDILLYDDENIQSNHLTIPHPRMHQRNFVMVPLYEIAPDLQINGTAIADILKNLQGEAIRKVT